MHPGISSLLRNEISDYILTLKFGAACSSMCKKPIENKSRIVALFYSIFKLQISVLAQFLTYLATFK